jgi:hypothetical protein
MPKRRKGNFVAESPDVDRNLEQASFSAAQGARKVVNCCDTAVSKLKAGCDILLLYDCESVGWVQGKVKKVTTRAKDKYDVKCRETATTKFPNTYKLPLLKTSYGRLDQAMSWMLLE